MNEPNEAVLVTGTSTGIGRATALLLARNGLVVYAGVRRESDGRALAAAGGPNVRPVILDVTDGWSIAAAVAVIRAAGVKLAGLVNNAGAAYAGPLEIMPLTMLREQFELNFFAPIALVQAVLPLLRKQRGRIINVSSIGGKLVTPYVGAYAASKHSLEAASDALRVEVAPFGVRVVLVEPGAVKTPIWKSASDRSEAMVARLDRAAFALYERQIGRLIELSQRQERDGTEPERVAAVIARALSVRRPRARYLVGRDAHVLRAVARLPDGVRDAIFRALFQREPGREHAPAGEAPAASPS